MIYKEEKYMGILDAIALVSIGAYCVFSSLFVSKFAEKHISLPFLNFPIFIGEILLAACIVILIVKGDLSSFSRRSYYLLAIYTGWVIFKAFWGYFTFGPLAFRNAALFYYPLFAVIGYHVFRTEFFTERIIFLLLLIFVIAVKIFGINQNYVLPYIFLYIILALKIRNGYIRYSILLLGLFIIPFREIAHIRDIVNSLNIAYISKTVIAGSIASICFLFLACAIILIRRRISKYYTAAIICLAVTILAGIFLLLGNKNQLRSLMAPRALLSDFQRKDQYVAKKIKYFKPRDFSVELYNPERTALRADDKRVGVVVTAYIIESVKNEIIWRIKQSIDSTEEQRTSVSCFRKISDDIERKIPPEDVIYMLYLYEEMTLAKRISSFEDFQAVSKRQTEDVFRAKKLAMEKTETMLARYNVSQEISPVARSMFDERYNMLFRLFVWRDMIVELIEKRPIFGFNFGKPQRSISIEILDMASGEWSRDGWIAPHNSFLHMVYRGGLVGISLVAILIGILAYTAKVFIEAKSATGILLTGILVYWLTMANFLVILELPYHAIPFWGLTGMTMAYSKELQRRGENNV